MSTELNNCPICGGAGGKQVGHGLLGPDWEECKACVGASPAAAVPEGALPPLPGPCKLTLPTGWIRYTAEQMQAYALAAVEADRAQHPPRVTTEMFDSLHASIEVLEDARGAREARMARLGLADRAQQGEPVDEQAAFEAWSARVAPAYGFDKDERGQYVAYPVHAGWAAWQARAKLATKAAAPADAPTDLSKRLRIKAGAMANGEKIAWGSDTELMLEAADYIERAAPVPDTGIPTAGEDERAKFEAAHGHMNLARQPNGTYVSGYTQIEWEEWPGRAPVSTTPTPGEVEKAESPMERLRRNDPKFAAHLDRCAQMVATWPAWKRVLWAKPNAAAPHPSEAKAGEAKACWSCKRANADGNCPHCGVEIEEAGEPCAHCNRRPGERRDECEHCPVGAKAGETKQ